MTITIDLISFVEEYKSTDNLSTLRLEIRHAMLHAVKHQNKGEHSRENETMVLVQQLLISPISRTIY